MGGEERRGWEVGGVFRGRVGEGIAINNHSCILL